MIDCLTGGLKKIKFKRLFNINREEYNIQVAFSLPPSPSLREFKSAIMEPFPKQSY